MSVSGGSVTETTISSLMSSTTYSIQVAAVNSAGTGVYSELLIVHTEGNCPYNLYICSIRHIIIKVKGLSDLHTFLQLYTSV